jgi:hypothetical protein
MRKVKFTQDLFDMKLGGILSEFPILDVSPLFPLSGHLKSASYLLPLDLELAPLPFLPLERSLRQEPLQACFGSA